MPSLLAPYSSPSLLFAAQTGGSPIRRCFTVDSLFALRDTGNMQIIYAAKQQY